MSAVRSLRKEMWVVETASRNPSCKSIFGYYTAFSMLQSSRFG